MRKLLPFLLLLLAGQVFGQTLNTDQVFQGISAPRNFHPNPTAVKNTVGLTASSVTMARDTDAADKFDGIASFALTSATHTASIRTNDIALPKPYADGGNCEVGVWFKGDASKWQLELRDSGGSNVLYDLDLTNESSWREASFNYPCTDDARIYVTSNAASPADINVAGFYWGPARNLSNVSQAKPIARLKRITSSQTVSSTSETVIEFNSSDWVYSGSFNSSTGVFTVTEPGVYVVNLNATLGSFTTGEVAIPRVRLNGTGGTQVCGARTSGNSTQVNFLCSGQYPMVAGDTISGTIQSSADTSYEVTQSINTMMEIWKLPSTSEIAVRPTDSGLTPWQSYTPTLTGSSSTGSVTYTQQSGHYRRVGDSIEVKWLFQLNTVSSAPGGQLLVSLPSGLELEPSKIANDASINYGNIFDASASGDARFIPINVRLNSSQPTSISLFTGSSAGLPTLATGDFVSGHATVPIKGWTYTMPAPLLVGSVTYSSTQRAGGEGGLNTIEQVSYTPTCTAGSGATSASCTHGNCTRIGNEVTCFIGGGFRATTANTTAAATISLPTSLQPDANFDGTFASARGTCVMYSNGLTGQGAIVGTSGAKTLTHSWEATNTNSRDYACSFWYKLR